MHEIKMDKYKGSLILKIAMACIVLFFTVSFIGQQMQISEKKAQLEAVEAELKSQQVTNEELKQSLEDSTELSDYAEKVARRDLDYAKPGERVFVDVGGSD
jgi:cell division protein FtsB